MVYVDIRLTPSFDHAGCYLVISPRNVALPAGVARQLRFYVQ
jgi:hypothetical protein